VTGEPLGYALELIERRKALAARLSPQARRLAFPGEFRPITAVVAPPPKPAPPSPEERPSTIWLPTKTPTGEPQMPGGKVLANVVVQIAAKHFEVPEHMVWGPCRKRIAVRARLAAFISLTAAGWSLAGCARAFRMDHTSCLHSMRVTRERLYDTDFKRRLDQLLADVARIARPALPNKRNAVTTSDTVTAAGDDVAAVTETVSHASPAKR